MYRRDILEARYISESRIENEIQENAMDCIVHRVAKSQTRLSDFHFLASQIASW